jgi:hypothetical protein
MDRVLLAPIVCARFAVKEYEPNIEFSLEGTELLNKLGLEGYIIILDLGYRNLIINIILLNKIGFTSSLL